MKKCIKQTFLLYRIAKDIMKIRCSRRTPFLEETYCNCGTVFSNPTRFKDFTEFKEHVNVACIKDHCYAVIECAYTEHRDLNKATRSSFVMRIARYNSSCILVHLHVCTNYYNYISWYKCRNNIALDGLSSICGRIYCKTEHVSFSTQ